MQSQLLTSKEAATYCRVSLSWLAHRRIEGGGPAFIKIGGKVHYRLSDLDNWIAQHVVPRQDRNSTSKTTGTAHKRSEIQ
jgi:predicted DNA-binding transcriptional regulator AlpA